MDSTYFQRIKSEASRLNMKINEKELRKICKHFGGSVKLFSSLEKYGWSSLLICRTIVEHYGVFPVIFTSKVTPRNGDCMHIGLRDGAKFSPPLQRKNLQKMYNTEMMWDQEKPRKDAETIENEEIYVEKDTKLGRRKINLAAMDLFSGHCNKSADSCDWNHHNIKPAEMTNDEWEGFWKLIMKPGVFDLPSKLGPLAENISDAQITLAAHFLRSHIIVFNGETNTILFVDGNYFKPGNVKTDSFPFILGRSKDHYQTLIPDPVEDHTAYEKIRDYVHEQVSQNEIGEVIMRSIKEKSASDDNESLPGPFMETISGKLIIYI